jgi:hypothetical protein
LKQIDVMRYCHKLGECRSTQYGMVRRFEVNHLEFDELLEVNHLEFDELGTIVLSRAEGDWEDHRT